MKKTSQSIYPPIPQADTLVLIMSCPQCNTHRGFRIGKTISECLNGSTGGYKIHTFCETCGHESEVTIGMAQTNIEWGRTNPFSGAAHAIEFQDTMGMQKPKQN